jgi:hypothetical protein
LPAAVHPGVSALHGPAFPGLDRGGCALEDDVGVIAQDIEQLAGLGRVVVAV